MQKLKAFIKNNYIWILLNLPASILFIYLVFHPKDFKTIIVIAAYTAFSLFVFTLSLNPLISLFPSQKWLKKINKHRRVLGVSVFVYACVHVSSFVAKRKGLLAALPWITHPIIFPGFAAFCILFILAITSNNYSIKKLTGPKWKRLHKTVYIAQWLVFTHMFMDGDEKRLFAIVAFVPLGALQWLRRRKKKAKC